MVNCCDLYTTEQSRNDDESRFDNDSILEDSIDDTVHIIPPDSAKKNFNSFKSFLRTTYIDIQQEKTTPRFEDTCLTVLLQREEDPSTIRASNTNFNVSKDDVSTIIRIQRNPVAYMYRISGLRKNYHFSEINSMTQNNSNDCLRHLYPSAKIITLPSSSNHCYDNLEIINYQPPTTTSDKKIELLQDFVSTFASVVTDVGKFMSIPSGSKSNVRNTPSLSGGWAMSDANRYHQSRSSQLNTIKPVFKGL